MDIQLILIIINVIVIPLASVIAFMLWNKITTIEKEQLDMADRIWAELKLFKHELDLVKSDYLDRFTDIKDLMGMNHLELIKNLSKLDTCLQTHVASSHIYTIKKENNG